MVEVRLRTLHRVIKRSYRFLVAAADKILAPTKDQLITDFTAAFPEVWLASFLQRETLIPLGVSGRVWRFAPHSTLTEIQPYCWLSEPGGSQPQVLTHRHRSQQWLL